MSDKASSNSFSTSIVKALSILNCFSNDGQELGISEISKAIGIPVGSVHRLIQSLEFDGLILQNRETKKYRLGTKILSLSKKAVCYQQYEKIAIRYADKLGVLADENVNISIYSAGQIRHIYTKQCNYVLRPHFPVDTPFSALTTSVGRVFLSNLSSSELSLVYDTFQNEIPMPFEDFFSLMSKFKQQGYATDDEVFAAGLRCVGAPIYLADGTVLFAISISAPTSRMNDEKYTEVTKLVVEYANEISCEIQNM